MILPDEFQKDVYLKEIEPNLKEGKILSFAHGFNIRFGLIKPPSFVDVVDCPKRTWTHCSLGISEWSRSSSTVAVEQDSSEVRDHWHGLR